MLLAAGYDVPRQLFVHGYLLLNDRKISKRERRRPARADRRLRRRRGPILVRTFGLVRPGRRRVDRGGARAVRPRARERPGHLLSRTTAMSSRYRGWDALRRLVGGLRVAAILAPARPRRGRSARCLRPDRRPRADLEVRGLNRHVEASAPAAGQGRLRGARPGALRPRRRACAPSPSRSPPTCRRHPRASSRRCASRQRSTGARSPTAAHVRPAGWSLRHRSSARRRADPGRVSRPGRALSWPRRGRRRSEVSHVPGESSSRRVAVCERPAPHRSRRASACLRTCARYHRLGKRRAHGERHRRARNAHHGRRGQGGVSPQELVDRNNEVIREDLRRLGLSYDLFTRRRREPPPRRSGRPDAVRASFLAERTMMARRHRPDALDRYVEGTCPI